MNQENPSLTDFELLLSLVLVIRVLPAVSPFEGLLVRPLADPHGTNGPLLVPGGLWLRRGPVLVGVLAAGGR